MIKWMIQKYLGVGKDGPPLHVGSRIMTPHGTGTVIGGSIFVRLENPVVAKNGSRNDGWSFNLDKLDEGVRNA